MNQPLISVVIPSFNQGQYIEETLISVIGQQYPNLEIIVVDGGSTDNTIEIIKKYEDKISYWHSKPDKGQADAINQGFKLSTGEILCWLNSDDMYLPGTLLDIGKRLADKTQENYLVYGGCIMYDQFGKQISCYANVSSQNAQVELDYIDNIIQPSSFWTKTLWNQTGILDINYNYVLDWEWYIRASNFTKFEYIPKLYSIYRLHLEHKSSDGGENRKKEILSIFLKNAPEYWQNLYKQVEKYHNSIKVKMNKLQKINGNLRRLIIYKRVLFNLYFPELNGMLNKIDDLYIILSLF